MFDLSWGDAIILLIMIAIPLALLGLRKNRSALNNVN